MNNKHKISIIVFSLALIAAGITNTYSQNSYFKGRWNLKLGYSSYHEIPIDGEKKNFTGNYRFECNYGLLDNLEPGFYFGYSRFNRLNGLSQTKKYHTPSYGLSVNFHILPFFANDKEFKFDLYLIGRYGGIYLNTPSDYQWNGHYDEYCSGGGLALYMWRHLGFYMEYSYGKYHFLDMAELNTMERNTKVRYGISFKF
jgi:hypothetical protein